MPYKPISPAEQIEVFTSRLPEPIRPLIPAVALALEGDMDRLDITELRDVASNHIDDMGFTTHTPADVSSLALAARLFVRASQA